MITKIIWKKMPNFSRYEISEFGKIRTVYRVLKGHEEKSGYTSYSLTNDLGKTRTIRAHVAVATAFHGPKPNNKHYAIHWDDDKANNYYKNIRWGTPTENKKDEKRNGRSNIGEINGSARLTENAVREIRKIHASGKITYKKLGSLYGVSVATICHVLKRQTWQHLK